MMFLALHRKRAFVLEYLLALETHIWRYEGLATLAGKKRLGP